MNASDTTPVTLPTSLVKELEPRAKKMGLSVAAYIAFIARVGIRQHDAEFANAAKTAFGKYPNALRKLAQ